MSEELTTREKVQHLASRGLAKSEIAEVLGRSRARIHQICSKYGIATARRRKDAKASGGKRGRFRRIASSDAAKGYQIGEEKLFAIQVSQETYAALTEAARNDGVSVRHRARMILDAWAAE